MPFGRSVTSYVANLYPTDPLAPPVAGDFAKSYPTDPLEGGKGLAVSTFVQNLYPTDPLQPTDLGSQLSDHIALLHSGIGTDSWDLFG